MFNNQEEFREYLKRLPQDTFEQIVTKISYFYNVPKEEVTAEFKAFIAGDIDLGSSDTVRHITNHKEEVEPEIEEFTDTDTTMAANWGILL